MITKGLTCQCEVVNAVLNEDAWVTFFDDYDPDYKKPGMVTSASTSGTGT